MVMSSYEHAIDTINKHLSAPLISRLGSGRRACVVQIDLLFRISPCDDCLACIVQIDLLFRISSDDCLARIG